MVALIDSGKPRAEAMREYDLGKSTLDRWVRRVHRALDAAVEAAYGVDFKGNEEKIVAHLFKLYAEKAGE